jgi:hypothetical protein
MVPDTRLLEILEEEKSELAQEVEQVRFQQTNCVNNSVKT